MKTKIRKFRIIIGEKGNEQGHIVPLSTRTIYGAKRSLNQELRNYGGDGWGKIQYLRQPANTSQSGQNEWDNAANLVGGKK